MRWKELDEAPCPIARALSVIGDRWTALIVRDAMFGHRRFEEFQRGLGVTRHVLADRLRRLTEEGVFDKVAYQERPLRHEYRLTEKGRALAPVLVAMGDWWQRHGGSPVEPRFRFRDGSTDQNIKVAIVNEIDGQKVDLSKLRAGPVSR